MPGNAYPKQPHADRIISTMSQAGASKGSKDCSSLLQAYKLAPCRHGLQGMACKTCVIRKILISQMAPRILLWTASKQLLAPA